MHFLNCVGGGRGRGEENDRFSEASILGLISSRYKPGAFASRFHRISAGMQSLLLMVLLGIVYWTYDSFDTERRGASCVFKVVIVFKQNLFLSSREIRNKADIQFGDNGTTISAVSNKAYVFVQNLSVGDAQSDLIRTLNIPAVVS